MSGNIFGQRSIIETMAKEVTETEHHLHNREVWFGTGPTEDGLTPFTLVSGNNDFGAAVELLAPGDTPFETGKTRFDAHRILPERIDTASLYLVRLIWDDVSVVAAEAALQYTTFPVFPTGVGSNIDGSIADVIAKRAKSGIDYLWAKCKNATNLAEVDILVGIHEYDK